MNSTPILSPAQILLPPYAPASAEWEKWAVIACDQFTSEPEYWEKAAQTAAGAPSALRLILPEAYLGTADEGRMRAKIACAMKELDRYWLRQYPDSMMYLRRTLPDGRVRCGLIGKIDLERYDYQKGSASAVRATEATVLERIPPRVAIRSEAVFELPHVMLLMEDTDRLFDYLCEHKDSYAPAYDFELMLGGGHVQGYRISGAALDGVTARLGAYEASRADGLVYAVGDGNHSLAAARAHYVRLKESLGDAALSHPARYALAEVVALQDPALAFEPIYRVVTGCDPEDLLAAFASVSAPGAGEQTVRVVCADGEQTVSFTGKRHALTVGTLQVFLDGYMQQHPEVRCDYIHDETSLLSLARRSGSVGFLFEGMPKEMLFPYVREHGTLPRKTFSMGEARSKRYYIEARRIIGE